MAASAQIMFRSIKQSIIAPPIQVSADHMLHHQQEGEFEMSWDWTHKHASMELRITSDAWHYKPESGELAACRNTAMECSASALRSNC